MSKKAAVKAALHPANSGSNAKGSLVHARINLQFFPEGTLAMAGGKLLPLILPVLLLV